MEYMSIVKNWHGFGSTMFNVTVSSFSFENGMENKNTQSQGGVTDFFY